jgi:glycosyltransferase involved in cell wall biosynthesis
MNPLVSILIPNYNKVSYIEDCLVSALNQSYGNIEVIISDNKSTDGSTDIIRDLSRKYKGEKITYNYNEVNIGAPANHMRCRTLMNDSSKFLVFLSSDDILYPNYVKDCVKMVREFPSLSYLIAHRDILHPNGVTEKELPFYNCSCIIPGQAQMAVNMVAGVGVSTQMFRARWAEDKAYKWGHNYDLCGDWYSNFVLGAVGNVGFLKTPLCGYRIDQSGHTSRSFEDLTLALEPYLMVKSFASIADQLGLSRVSARLDEGYRKIGKMCIRYAYRAVCNDNFNLARRYINLSMSISPDPNQSRSSLLKLCIMKESGIGVLSEYAKKYPMSRNCSYDPPLGSIIL